MNNIYCSLGGNRNVDKYKWLPCYVLRMSLKSCVAGSFLFMDGIFKYNVLNVGVWSYSKHKLYMHRHAVSLKPNIDAHMLSKTRQHGANPTRRQNTSRITPKVLILIIRLLPFLETLTNAMGFTVPQWSQNAWV